MSEKPLGVPRWTAPAPVKIWYLRVIKIRVWQFLAAFAVFGAGIVASFTVSAWIGPVVGLILLLVGIGSMYLAELRKMVAS